MLIPAFEPSGRLASIHARAVVVDVTSKTLWPKGCQARGLLFADPRGRALLKGVPILWLHGVLIVEGATDLIAAALWAAERCARRREGIAVLGVTAGGAEAFSRVELPDVPIHISTDPDKAGDTYAKKICANLPRTTRARVQRIDSRTLR